MTSVLTHLGAMSVGHFMRNVWQCKPCLIRAAFAADFNPIAPQSLLRLAARADVESRLITRFKNTWRLRHGPLAQLPLRQRRDWTVLVQGLDLIDPHIHALMQRFRFIADARLDDVMASYAVPGGGVGPHIDSYDVFLLQAHGRRRWRISRQRDTTLVDDAPVKLLAHFEPTQEWTLEPGDMLYLPPGVAHDGVALDECITLSIGFRTPTWAQLAEPWFDDMAAQLQHVAPYRDAATQPTRTPARLPPQLLARTHATLARLRPTRQQAQRALLMHLTEPKAQVIFEPLSRPLSQSAFAKALHTKGIALDPRSRMLYSGNCFALNGELITVPRPAIACMQQLANQRQLSKLATPLDEPTLAWLHEGYCSGWLHIPRTSQ